MHRFSGISSTGFLGIERQPPFPAIEDIILDNIRGESWVAEEESSGFELPVEKFGGYADISFWY